MIFDFFFEYSFKENKSNPEDIVSFKQEPMYKDIEGKENCITFNNGYCTTMNRRDFNDSFFRNGSKYLWIFGYVYTNKRYESTTGNPVSILTARDLFALISRHPEEWQYLIKGSYVIVMFDEREHKVNAYTDFLNVLPLYYAVDGDNLIISSNTALMLKRRWVDRTPDRLALVMQQLFDYMLGECYFVKGIRRMENARCYSFGTNGVKKQVYWDVEKLKHDKLLPKKKSLVLLGDQLKENVNLYADYAHPVLVSMTGGFDGRTNVAMLERDPKSFKCYSYGMAGSKQIMIPKKIADHIGIQYEPIYLDTEFVNEYSYLSNQASYFSNGTAPLGFANKPYAYSILNCYSDTIITGLFGSEILRPMHNNGIQTNDQSYAIFLNKNIRKGIKEAIDNIKGFTFSDFNICDYEEELYTYLTEHYFDKYRRYDRLNCFFLFFIQEGIRKYFSQEMSLERVFVTTKIPYFDIDLVELIYQTTWAGLYNGFLGESKFKRRKGQLLYAHIMRRFMPEIMDIEMDRGYKPKSLLYPFPFNYFIIALGVYNAKKYLKNAGGNDTFKTETWAMRTLDQLAELPSSIINIKLGAKMLNDSLKMADRGRFLTYTHLASLKQFMYMVESKER
jgi:hypothetical protein